MKDLEIQEQAENPAKFFLKQKGIHPTEPIYWDLATTTISLDDLLDEYAKWMQEQDKAESKAVELLRKLVALKAYKDKTGKDLYYAINQPQAWQDAKEFLAKITLPSPPKTK